MARLIICGVLICYNLEASNYFLSEESDDSTITLLQREAPLSRRDSTGALRVGESRVLLELVIRAFEDGTTPETIAQRYPIAMLTDIYGVIAYCLRHRDEVDAYLPEREQQAE